MEAINIDIMGYMEFVKGIIVKFFFVIPLNIMKAIPTPVKYVIIICCIIIVILLCIWYIRNKDKWMEVYRV